MNPRDSSTGAPLVHPGVALLEAGESVRHLPVCDHYCGTEERMRKALALQAERGPVFDITLDGEDGAPVGGEVDHAHLMAELAAGPLNVHQRVGARVHPIDHHAFEAEVDILLSVAGQRLAYLMLPKINGVADVDHAITHIHRVWQSLHGSVTDHLRPPPLHVLIETHGALREVDAIAAHPEVESLSFGLMDFVSAHRGAIPDTAMSAQGQFEHPLVCRAKLDIAAAAHGHGKVPSHCVVTELKDHRALARAAEQACKGYGYTRMWSIHPSQIETIVEAFAPTVAEVDHAIDVLTQGEAAQWGPIRHSSSRGDTLHDRASYRYYWYLLQRAHLTGQALPGEIEARWFGLNSAT